MAATKFDPKHLVAQLVIGSSLGGLIWYSLQPNKPRQQTVQVDVVAQLDAEAAQSSAVHWGLKDAPTASSSASTSSGSPPPGKQLK